MPAPGALVFGGFVGESPDVLSLPVLLGPSAGVGSRGQPAPLQVTCLACRRLVSGLENLLSR